MKLIKAAAVIAFALAAIPSFAQNYPAPKQGEWIVRDFKFHTGEVLPELKLAYTTVGEPTGEPVLLIHGTAAAGGSLLNANFAGQLLGPGQPLDATKHFIIIPDAIGGGRSSKPSDGLKAKFPKYNYDDMVDAQYRLLTEHLGIKRLRVIVGQSMGGMHAWVWGVRYPGFMDALVPLASQPTAMSSRNWMLRRMMIEAIRTDPDYKDGNYTEQPRSLKFANVFFGIATNGGNFALQKAAPTSEAGDKIIRERLAARGPQDANDFIYRYEASYDYDPSPNLQKIQAMVLAVNAADDERNPPETGVMEQALKRIKNARLLLIPASEQTRGHGTTGQARFFADALRELMQSAPRRAM
jgi:homoserine O-acetyltransferase